MELEELYQEKVAIAHNEEWLTVAKALRQDLLRISRHPKTRPKDRAQADMFLCYSFKGIWNYRTRINHFIKSVKL